MHFDKSWSLLEKHGLLRQNDLISLRHVAKLLLIDRLQKIGADKIYTDFGLSINLVEKKIKRRVFQKPWLSVLEHLNKL